MNARRRTRPLFAALAASLCFVSCASAQDAQLPPPLPPMRPPASRVSSRPRVISMNDASIDRVHDWLATIGDHTPGEYDAPLATIASWQPAGCRCYGSTQPCCSR